MGVTTLLLVAGILAWIAAALLIEGWQDRRGPPEPLDRRVGFRSTVADEAQEWLDNRL